MAEAKSNDSRVEDELIDLDLVAEGDMLKCLSAHYHVNFISTEKLAKADVARALVTMIPRRFAEKLRICPVIFDSSKHVLTIVTAEPDDTDLLKELQLASGARDVKAVLARPAAIKALVSKVYGGDAHAFALLDRAAHMQFHSMPGDARAEHLFENAPRASGARTRRGGRERVLEVEDSTTGGRARGPEALPRAPPAARRLRRPRQRRSSVPRPRAGATALPARSAPAPQIAVARRSRRLRGSCLDALTSVVLPGGAQGGSSFVELLNVLVSLLESARTDLRGHSAAGRAPGAPAGREAQPRSGRRRRGRRGRVRARPRQDGRSTT